jgi:hypothetical protein
MVVIEAIRHSFDGYGWQYIDSGSGSDWLERGMSYPDAEALYTVEKDAEIARLREKLLLIATGGFKGYKCREIARETLGGRHVGNGPWIPSQERHN